MEPATDHPDVCACRSRRRQVAGAHGCGELAARLGRRARVTPFLADFTSLVGEEGERASSIVFDSLAHPHAWRDDPEHRAAHQRRRDASHSEYAITVCREVGRRTLPHRARVGGA